jgi:hypothetical protein
MAETTNHLVAFQHVASGRLGFRTVQATSPGEASSRVMETLAGSKWRETQAENPVVRITAVVPDDRVRSATGGATEIANGWTTREAQAMDAHISAKVASNPYRAEAPNSSYRQAERVSDATNPMHDFRREAQANAYQAATSQPVSQMQRDSARSQATPAQAPTQAQTVQQQVQRQRGPTA